MAIVACWGSFSLVAIVQVGQVLKGVRALLVAGLPAGIKVGAGKAPDGAGLGYVVLFASTTAARDLGSWGNPEGSGRVRVQLTAVGSTDEQSNAIMDRCLDLILTPDEANGGFLNPILPEDHDVWFRSKVADVGSANEGPNFQRTFLLDFDASFTGAPGGVPVVSSSGLSSAGWQVHTHGSQQLVSSGVRTKLLCDGAGGEIVSFGRSSRIRWDTASSKLIAADDYSNHAEVRISMDVTASVAERELLVEIDIGGTVGVIVADSGRLGRAAGAPETQTFSFPVYSLGTFAANGAELFLTVDGAVTLDNVTVAVFQ